MEIRKKSKKEQRQEESKEKLEDEKLARIHKIFEANKSKITQTKFNCGEDVDNYLAQALQGISEQEIYDALNVKVDRLINLWELLLDELNLMDAALKDEKDHNYNVHEVWTYTPQQAEYSRTLIGSIVNLETLRKGIMLTLINLKGNNRTNRGVAVIASAAKRDELRVLLRHLKRVRVAVETKQVEELLSRVDKVVAGQMNFTL